MRICTYITLRFKRRRGRWGQVLISEALCNCASERPPRLCAAGDPALQWAAREAVEREAARVGGTERTDFYKILTGAQELLFRVVHTEIVVPMIARRRPVDENEPSRLTSQTLSGSSASTSSRGRAASRAANLYEMGGDAGDSQICTKRCCGEERYRTGGDSDSDGDGGGGGAAAVSAPESAGADGKEPIERSLRVTNTIIGSFGFTVVRRKCEPWTLVWDGLILVNTALIFFQNVKLEWLVPCSPSAVAFEWISLLFLSLFVVELVVEGASL